MKLKRRVTEQLSDGSTGYSMLPGRRDECFRAAIATVLQIPPSEIPDPQLERRLRAGDDPAIIASQSWRQLHDWLRERGLRIRHHATDAALVEAMFAGVIKADQRWIGVCPGVGAEAGIAEQLEAASNWGRTGRRELLRPTDLKHLAKRLEHFCDHCVVMARGDVLFDPARALEPPSADLEARVWGAEHVERGYSFEPIQGDD